MVCNFEGVAVNRGGCAVYIGRNCAGSVMLRGSCELSMSSMHKVNKENGLALLAGLSCVAVFAPFGIFPIPVAALALLFVLWGRCDKPREAAYLGFFFGLGF